MGLFGLLGLAGNEATATEARNWVEQGATLLDVRTPAEFAGGHLSGAKNIPVQELGARIQELPTKTKKVVVYCRSGARSAAAASLLRKSGYEVHDLGAMSNWGN